MKKIVLLVISSIALIFTFNSTAYAVWGDMVIVTFRPDLTTSETTVEYEGVDYNYYFGGQVYLSGSSIGDLNSFVQNQALEGESIIVNMSLYGGTHFGWSGYDGMLLDVSYMIWNEPIPYQNTVYIYNSNDLLIYTGINVSFDNPVVYYPLSSNANYQYQLGLKKGEEKGYNDGFRLGRIDGFEEATAYYGYEYQGNYITAEQYGNIRFGEGYDKGITTEIDWFNWAFTFITMPVRILNVEVLPNIKIGYFALFTLMTGIISWFFFIVGKGGRKK